MPPSRPSHDPFVDAPLRPTSANATSLPHNPALRAQTSQHSLRSNTSTTSTRARRQQRDLFAPSLTRRANSRTTPRVEGEVLADSDSEPDLAAQRQQRQTRRSKHGSPEGRHGRVKAKQAEEVDFVNRRADGGYLLGDPGLGASTELPRVHYAKTVEELEAEDVNRQYSEIARQFFASGAGLGGKVSKKQEEELEQLKLPMMITLREQYMEKLESERWQYEPTKPLQHDGY